MTERYRLTNAARGDLSAIWEYSVRIWSIDQAERYIRGLSATIDTLVETPEIGRMRDELDRPVRLHPHRSHLIVYHLIDGELEVVRVLHARQNWRAVLQGN